MTKRSQHVIRPRFIKNPTLKAARLPLAVGFASLFLAGCKTQEPPPVIDVSKYENLGDCVNQNPNFADHCRAAYLRHMAQQEVESKLYESPEQCIASNPGKDLECLEEWERAQEAAEVRAPRFASQRECESSFDGCRASSSGDYFLPLVTGYLMGSMSSSSAGVTSSRSVSSPVFTPSNNRENRVTASGAAIAGASSGQSVRMTAGQMNNRHQSTLHNNRAVTNTRATGSAQATGNNRAVSTTRSVSRGGFGSSARAGGSWGG